MDQTPRLIDWRGTPGQCSRASANQPQKSSVDESSAQCLENYYYCYYYYYYFYYSCYYYFYYYYYYHYYYYYFFYYYYYYYYYYYHHCYCISPSS